MTLPAPLSEVDAALRDHFGQTPLRASVSFLGVDPIEVLRFEPIPDERALLSLGMSRYPMTAAEQTVRTQDGPRAELMVHLRDPGDRWVDVWRRVALLAASPSVEGVVYVEGMSIDLGEPLVAGSRCTGVVITESPVPDVDSPVGTVRVLQAQPATQTELAWCRVHGSAALRERWLTQGVDLLDLERPGAALD